jgi:WD40 repeat protein
MPINGTLSALRLGTLSALFVTIFFGVSACPSAARAQQQPSSDPILRVETEMHTAGIPQAAADISGQMLATASEDKTLRLWSIARGELIRVLRPPIGMDNEGKLYAVAMSPDGKFVVTGGWTGFQWEQKMSLYVFETGSGRLVRRIPGFPNTIGQLAWSRDGRFVAVALIDNGIRVLRTEDWQEAASDTEYSDLSLAIAFDRSGRLAAASYDGYVRLYDAEFRRIAKVKAPSGSAPRSVAFSPDGTRVAVGYRDTTAVDVLSADDLHSLFSANTEGVSNGNLPIVAWSADGALLAGGEYYGGNGRPILRWAEAGVGKRQALSAADNTIMSIIPLADGGFVYASADPAFGQYDARLQRQIERKPEQADFRNSGDKFALETDGSTVAFGLDVSSSRPVSFSLKTRQLESPGAAGDLASADTHGLPITDWHSNFTPKLAGKPLKLQPNETSESIAIAPGRRSFLLGAQWNIYRFDDSGGETWSHVGPGIAWAVNLSRDGRLAVAAFSDGTIRWYRYSDGRELLALFVHRDGKRWVLWTPEGYYDASPGAEDLIGWHVNRGLDHAADFFPASRFRDRFYKPDVVSAVLRTLDTDAALKREGARATGPITAEELPPVIKILAPQEGSAVGASPVQVRYSVRSPSGERVTAIEVKLDGRPLPGSQGVIRLENGPASPQAELEGAVAVPIDKDATVTLIARAGERTSEAVSLRLAWKPTIAEPPSAIPKPKLYMLAIGVSRYKNTHLQLHYAAKDAADVAAAWARQQGGLYSQVVVKILRDDEATREAVLDGLDWIERETTQRDIALVLLSGHGDNDADGAYYFLPYDVDPDRLRRTAVPDLEIRRSLSHVAGKALFFFDTCHSGSVMGSSAGRRARPIDINGFVNELASAESGLVVFAASTGREFALERDDWQNGAFSKALVEGLSGKADISGRGIITISELEYWLAERVKTLTGGKQHPTTAKPSTIRDFPIAVARIQ